MMSFAEKMLAARTELGMTQKQLAEATDLSIRTILSYEKGEKEAPRRHDAETRKGSQSVSQVLVG